MRLTAARGTARKPFPTASAPYLLGPFRLTQPWVAPFACQTGARERRLIAAHSPQPRSGVGLKRGATAPGYRQQKAPRSREAAAQTTTGGMPGRRAPQSVVSILT